MDTFGLCIVLLSTVIFCAMTSILMLVILDKYDDKKKEDKQDGEKRSDKESKE